MQCSPDRDFFRFRISYLCVFYVLRIHFRLFSGILRNGSISEWDANHICNCVCSMDTILNDNQFSESMRKLVIGEISIYELHWSQGRPYR
jgi:hypothetical protein